MSTVPTPKDSGSRPLAVVTGASSGIGAATVRHLAGAGFDVVAGARRVDRLEELAKEVGPAVRPLPLDVTVAGSIDAFAKTIRACQVLVNDAGGALGQERIAESVDDIAEIITFVVTRPAHVDIDTLIVRPRDQARTWLVHRS